jgi:Mrp family chromosome partitioning ATPase
MEPIQYLRTIRRRWWIIAVFAIVGLMLGAATGLGHKKATSGTSYWRATCVLYYDGSALGDNAKAGPYTALNQMGLFATTGDVPAQVAHNHKADSQELTQSILAVVDPVQSTVRITHVGTDDQATAAMANEWCTALKNWVNLKNVQAWQTQVNESADTLTTDTKKINALQATNPPAGSVAEQQLQALINQYRLDDEQFQALPTKPGDILTSLQQATPVPVGASAYSSFLRQGQLQANNIVLSNNTKNPEIALDSSTATKSKIPKGPLARGLIGAFLGLMLGLAAAFAIERLDTRLQGKEDTEQAFDLPVLAEVPALTRAQRSDTEVLSYTHPMSRTAEAYRTLRSSIVFLRQTAMAERGPEPEGRRFSQVILVSSAGPAEGKTTTVANLAAVFAEAEYSVLVINCDFRRPRLHRYLGGSDEARKVVQSDIPGVRMVNNVLSSSHPNPAEVTAAQRRVVEAARGIFDVILLDTAPLLSTNDATELVGVADLVVLVARTNRTTRPNAYRATEVLRRLEATVAGVALTGTRYAPTAQYYYYATEQGTDPNRPDAESHPLDLLVRADDFSAPRTAFAGTMTEPHPESGAEDELTVELQSSAGSGPGPTPDE